VFSSRTRSFFTPAYFLSPSHRYREGLGLLCAHRTLFAMTKLIKLSQEQAREIDAELVAYNAEAVPFIQKDAFHRLNYGISDDGVLIAGVGATLYCWGILYVDVVWVEKQHRQQGVGTMLMTALEAEAQKLGCSLVHLDTFDFQARQFYEKQGYTLFGTLADCPPGHERFFLKKVLTSTASRPPRHRSSTVSHLVQG